MNMSNLLINERRVDGVVILDLVGGIRLGKENAYLHNAIREVVDSGEKNVLLNLGQVTKIDSSGMGELIAAWTTLRTNGGEAKLLNLTQTVEHLMTLTKLLTVFDTYENEADAVASFKSKTTGPLDGEVWKNADASGS
jgi:anti-sigma B factor antagonist